MLIVFVGFALLDLDFFAALFLLWALVITFLFSLNVFGGYLLFLCWWFCGGVVLICLFCIACLASWVYCCVG